MNKQFEAFKLETQNVIIFVILGLSQLWKKYKNHRKFGKKSYNRWRLKLTTEIWTLNNLKVMEIYWTKIEYRQVKSLPKYHKSRRTNFIT